MPEDGFTFVGVSGQTDLDIQTTNKLVRSHVMRRYKRQQKASSPKQRSSPPSDKEPSIPDTSSSGEFTSLAIVPCTDAPPTWTAWSPVVSTAVSPESLASRNIATSEQRSHSARQSPSRIIQTWLDGHIDPFSSLPIKMDRRSLMLLQRNASSPLRTSVHADPRGIYRAICSKDPAWLFMHLYYAACRFSQSLDQYDCEATQYLLQSESAISNSIRGSPNMIDDSTVATVACLANIENLKGDASTAYIHMDGLKRMVQIRGGLSNLGMQGVIRRMVLWSDLLTSLNFMTVPYFPFSFTEKPFELWHFISAPLRNSYHLTINPELATIVTQKHGIIVSDLLLSLHQLAIFLNSVGDGLLPWDACYPDRVYEVEYGIALALYDDHVMAENDEKVEIGRLLLQAALLYVYSSLRQTPVGGTIRETLTWRLRVLLNDMDLAYYYQRFTAEMLWVLIIGASSAAGAARDEFLDDARKLCVETQIDGWIEVTDVVKNMPSLLDDCMATFRDIWIPT